METTADDRKKRILVVEDEAHLAKGLKFNLTREGYDVELAGDGDCALEGYRTGSFDMMILDLMLPKRGGLEVVRAIRQSDVRFPVLMLTARSADEDRASGLEAGADDYLTKPFHLPELLLRVKGILRRGEWYKEQERDEEVFQFGDRWVNLETGQALGSSGEFILTHKEAMIMNLLISSRGQVVSRDELLEKVWGFHPDTETRTLDNFISRLRKYFEKKPQKPEYILTVREKGYQFRAES